MTKSAVLGLVVGILVAIGLAFLVFGGRSPDVDVNNPGNVSQTSYVDYDASLVQQADDKRVVLFFNASWCPTCRIADKNFMTQALSGGFPEDLVILSVDYDNHESLRRQYGITSQHTYVQVDSDGQALKIWVSSLTLGQIVEQLAP